MSDTTDPSSHVPLFDNDTSVVIEGRRFLPRFVPQTNDAVDIDDASFAFDATRAYLALSPDERRLLTTDERLRNALLAAADIKYAHRGPFRIAVDRAADAFHGEDREYHSYLATITQIVEKHSRNSAG